MKARRKNGYRKGPTPSLKARHLKYSISSKYIHKQHRKCHMLAHWTTGG